RDDVKSDAPRYFLIQFRGPIREAWLSGVRRDGVEPIQYVADNAFLVRATDAQMASMSRRPEVRWSSPLHPAYKLSDDLGWLLGRPVRQVQSARQLYRVAVFRNANLDGVIAAIETLGGKVEKSADVGTLYFRNLRVEIDLERLADLASLHEVCRIETWYPHVAEDERSNQ